MEKRTLRIDFSVPLKFKKIRFDVIGEKGKSFIISSRKVLIGSSPSASLRLQYPTVSKIHCEICFNEDNQITIKDLGSTNGTFLNSARIKEAYLSNNDVLRLGNVELKTTFLDEEYRVDLYPKTEYFGITGRSLSMREIFSKVEQVSDTDIPILIEGETGTGKELLAEAIHARSKRSEKKFIVCDLSTVPENLIASELFGHEKGAFTGADSQRIGLIEEANGGTVFLDEIAELRQESQNSLLRVLEKKEIRRLGSNKTVQVDVRFIAATSRKIDELVEQGAFRQDLFFRIAIFRIKIPPLRERKEDIPLLINSFLRTHTDTYVQLSEYFSKNMKVILDYSWPGNVRELKNTVERVANIYKASKLLPEIPMLAPNSNSNPNIYVNTEKDFKEGKKEIIENFEERYISEILKKSKGNISEAARLAKIDRKYMERLIKKYNVVI